ncbi:MAG: hypothetical protein ABUT20_30415, partial [Bacteroidota bacterium]
MIENIHTNNKQKKLNKVLKSHPDSYREYDASKVQQHSCSRLRNYSSKIREKLKIVNRWQLTVDRNATTA